MGVAPANSGEPQIEPIQQRNDAPRTVTEISDAKDNMRIGLALNEPTVEQLTEGLQLSREDGLSSVWLTDPVFGADALTTIAATAHSGNAIEVATAVTPTYFRHPATLARQAITVDAATNGRLTLGIGLSHKTMIEGNLGLSFDKPIRHMREYLDILTPLLRDGTVEADGETLRANLELNIRPTGPVPVLLAALGKQMLEVAGSMAGGTITWMVGPKVLAEHVIPTITAAAERAKKPPPRVVAIAPIAVTDNPKEFREAISEGLALYDTLPSYKTMMDREGAAGPGDLAIVGDENFVHDELGRLAEIGVAGLVGGNPDEQARTRALLKDAANA